MAILTFVVLAAWTLLQWRRWRSRLAAYLAIAFTSLAIAIVISRLDTQTAVEIPGAG